MKPLYMSCKDVRLTVSCDPILQWLYHAAAAANYPSLVCRSFSWLRQLPVVWTCHIPIESQKSSDCGVSRAAFHSLAAAQIHQLTS